MVLGYATRCFSCHRDLWRQGRSGKREQQPPRGIVLVTLLAALVVTATYGGKAVAEKGNRPYFVLHIVCIAMLLCVFHVASPHASQFASVRLQAKIDCFVKDPINCKAEVSSEEKQLMVEIERQKFTIQRSAFIATFQRVDCLIRTEQGGTYLLVMEATWIGTPVISLRRLQG